MGTGHGPATGCAQKTSLGSGTGESLDDPLPQALVTLLSQVCSSQGNLSSLHGALVLVTVTR